MVKNYSSYPPSPPENDYSENSEKNTACFLGQLFEFVFFFNLEPFR